MLRACLTCIALAMVVLASPARAEPFEQLRAAYAALAYSSDAEVIYRYAGAPEERHVGRAAIEASFAALFALLDPADRPDLSFRQVSQEGRRRSGFYRLRLGAGTVLYGAFAVELSTDGLFARDISTDATVDDFDAAPAAAPGPSRNPD